MTGSGHGGDALRQRDAQGGDEAPALDEIRRKLKSLRIEVKSDGNELGRDYLADALIQAADTILKYFFPFPEDCEERPNSSRQSSGVGFATYATTFCWGRVEIDEQIYHVHLDYLDGYNSSGSWAYLLSIEIIPHSKVASDG